MEHKNGTQASSLARFVSFLVIVTGLVMVLSQRPPASLPANAPAADFSAERAFRHRRKQSDFARAAAQRVYSQL